MALTNVSKALIAGAGVIVVGGLATSQYLTINKVNKLEQQPAQTITKTIVVTPTVQPTATPSALLKYTPVKTVTKGVAK